MEAVTPTRSYRCTYHPQADEGCLAPTSSGVWAYVEVKASDSRAAQRKAHAVTGCPVSQVERMEAAA